MQFWEIYIYIIVLLLYVIVYSDPAAFTILKCLCLLMISSSVVFQFI